MTTESSSPIKWQSLIFTILIGMTTATIGIYDRLYPLRHHISFDASEKATVLVIANMRKRVRQAIEHNFPNLSETERQMMMKNRFDQLLHNDKDEFHKTVDRVAHEIDRAAYPRQKYPYLLAADSFYYYELTENITTTGRMATVIKGSKYFHPLMAAPEGFWQPLNWHPYVGYGVYRFLKFFDSSLPLMYAVSFTPLLITILSLIPFLGLCRFMNAGYPAMFLGTLFLLLAPINIKRSMFGWYDDDPYSILFPLLILWILFTAAKNRTNFKSIMIWTGLGALSFALYALFWHGWMFLLVIIVGGILLTAGYEYFIIKDRSALKPLLQISAVVSLGTLLGITLFFGFDQFFILFDEGFKALKDFLEPAYSLWPDAYIAVGELHKTPPPELVNLMGGWVFAVFALFGLADQIIALIRRKSRNPLVTITISVFFGLTLLMSLGAQRFAILFMTPASLTTIWGIQGLFDRITPILLKRLPPNRRKAWRLTAVPILITVIIALWPLRYAAIETPTLLNQIFNSTWEEALIKIRDGTPADSIINSWWAPGHFIKAVAHRRVVFDGASINVPQSYWMANILLSTSEHKALGLLRMLNASANEASEYLTSLGWKLSDAVQLIKTVTAQNETQARQTMQDHHLAPQQTDKLISLTHRHPPPSYFLIYNEMVDKNIEYSYVGNWNITKMEELNTNPRARAAVPRPNSKNYIPYIWQQAGGAPKYSGIFSPLIQNKDSLMFEQNIEIDLANMTVTINSPTYGKGIPQALIYKEKDRIITKTLPGANLSYAVVFFQRNGSSFCVLMDMDLAQSLLMKLYFFNGTGFRYIRPFFDTEDMSGRTQIQIFEVDWDGFLAEELNPAD